jgi:DNA uptake protein ComE-like DNA-binding protein
MLHSFTRTVLSVAVLILSFTIAYAETGKAPGKPAAESKVAAKDTKKASAKTKKKAAKAKLVDINSAAKADLMKLPGITEANAAGIIANRPYGSKAHLVTKKVLSSGAYQAISHLIIAKQPYVDSSKNAEALKGKK